MLLVDPASQPASQPVPSLDPASAGPLVDVASADPLSGPTTRGGGGTLQYLGVLGMCRWCLFGLPALAQGFSFELPELGQGVFLSFQLCATA